MNKIFVMLALLVMVALSSCSVFEGLLYDVAENVEITWDRNKAAGAPIDSVRIVFRDAYWLTDLTKLKQNQDYYAICPGYQVWYVLNDSLLRVEVIKKDTTIYIYKK